MMKRLLSIALCLAPLPVAAQDIDPPEEAEATADWQGAAIGTDLFLSGDADGTSVFLAGLTGDILVDGPDTYTGIKIERADFTAFDGTERTDERIYARIGRDLGDWALASEVGTDGETVLGSIALREQGGRFSEFFVEREIVESPLGLSDGIYYTFLGAATNLDLAPTTSLSLLAGAQEFTGENVRIHGRATLTQSLKEDWGLSAQLRTRAYHSTEPFEYDYYSPEYYVQAIPTLQLRRYSEGWRYSLAAGWGAQKDDRTDWRSSRLLEARATSPRWGRLWLEGYATYAEQPGVVGDSYDYGAVNVALRYGI